MKVIRFASLALIPVLAVTMHAQNFKVLVNFKVKPSQPVQPGIIAQSRGGYLLSTSLGETADQHGEAFRVTTAGAVTVLHEFDIPANGEVTPGGLTLSTNGRFYGTTLSGGTNNSGTIFEMTPNGTVKTLHEFPGNGNGHPQAPPIQSLSGDFYGTTYGNDQKPDTDPGTVYKINSNGSYTLLHSFTVQDGANPLSPLVQDATNFWFYGTAEHGGSNFKGTIFRISHSGEFEVLYKFDTTHGRFPMTLIQASDGNFYGMARAGGPFDAGVVFKMTPTHQVTVLHNFTGGSDGAEPLGNLIQATDGFLYGTSAEGGSAGGGVLFRISTTGKFTVLHNFQKSTGFNPIGLIQHTNGFLYGDTAFGGLGNGGVFYRYDLGLGPFITYLPSWGSAGLPVDILGQGFTSDTKAFFNGVRAQIVTVEPTYMRVVVPPGATTGWITVTTTKGTLKSNKKFIVHS